MLKQILVARKSHIVDEGIMGFHDYEDEKEPMEAFVKRVSLEANKPEYQVLAIEYPNDSLAIIIVKED